MKHDSILPVISNFIKYFSEQRINKIAKAIGFMKRDSKLKPIVFFKAFTFGICHMQDISLRNIALFCEDIQENLSISRQALEARLLKGSELMKIMFENVMSYRLSQTVSNIKFNNIIDLFNDIVIYDSSSFEVDESLEKYWPGYGGNNSKAGIKIQAVYSLARKAFKKIDIMGETSNDRTYTCKVVDTLKANDLAIGDLGFYNQKDFIHIVRKGAHFISKVKSNTLFYEPSKNKSGKFDKVDISEMLKESSDSLDTELYIGGNQDTRIKCRVVAKRLPEKEINKKLRKVNKKAKQQGRTVKDKDKEFYSWIIMITDVNKEVLKSEDIFALYRVRWQIEIIFKCWKSHICIDRMANIGKYYAECSMYGKLIIITLTTVIYSIYFIENYSMRGREISILMFLAP